MKKNKKGIILLVLWVILMIPACLIVKNSAVNLNRVQIQGIEQTFSTEDVGQFSGYQKEGNQFSVSGYDPGFYLEDLNTSIASVQIVFEHPVESNMEIQMFYKRPKEEISEDNSLKKYIHKGTEEIIFSIPRADYELLRFDIEGDFSLKSISISPQDRVIAQEGKVKINIMAYGAAGVFLAALLWLVVCVLKIPENISHFFGRLESKKEEDTLHYQLQLIYLVIYAFLLIGLVFIYKHNLFGMIKNRYVLIHCLSFLTMIYIVAVNIRRLKDRLAGVACMAVIIAGLCYALTLPVGTQVSTDDEVHYRRAVCLSHVFDGYLTEADEYIYTNKVLPEYHINSLMAQNTQLNTLYESGETIKCHPLQMEFYSAVSYLPSAVGLLAGRGLGLSFAKIFFLGRCMNVFVYALLIYYAIKKLKSGKLILAVIALLPTNIFYSGSYGYDAWLTGFTLLAIAYLIRFIQDKEYVVKGKDVAVVMASFILGLAPKAVYFPLFGLCFLVPAARFENKNRYKKYIICTVICALIVLASFALPFVIGGTGGNDIRGGAEVNSGQQIKFILHNPVEYAKILLNHMKTYLAVENQGKLLASMMHMGDSHYFVLVFLTLAAAVFCDRSEEDDYANHIAARVWTLVVSLACVVLVSTALYVSFTPVGSSVVSGCQYRYLMPMLYPTAYFVFNIKITNRADKNLMYMAGIGIMFMILLSGASEQWIRLYWR